MARNDIHWRRMKKLLEFTLDSFFCSVHYLCRYLCRYFMVYYDGMTVWALDSNWESKIKRHQKTDCHTLTTLVLPNNVKQVKISKDIYTRYPKQKTIVLNQKHTGSWFVSYLKISLSLISWVSNKYYWCVHCPHDPCQCCTHCTLFTTIFLATSITQLAGVS